MCIRITPTHKHYTDTHPAINKDAEAEAEAEAEVGRQADR